MSNNQDFYFDPPPASEWRPGKYNLCGRLMWGWFPNDVSPEEKARMEQAAKGTMQVEELKRLSQK